MANRAKGLESLGNVFGINNAKSNASSTVTKKDTPANDTATYKVLQTQERVLVKVAQESGFMARYSPFTTTTGEKIPVYWKNGKPLKGGTFLNVHFYGIDNRDLGRNVIGTVKVIEKTLPDGRKFVMLDVFKTPDTAPLYDLKLPEGNNGGIPIPQTVQEVVFRPRPVYNP